MSCASCGGLLEQDAAFCGICGSRVRARRETLVGSVLADAYRIESKIAEGGFGTIYQATHVASGLDCALKVLHADLAQDPNLAARFRREGATLSRLHDPHTVATYDVGETPDGTLYIAMELLRGENLHERIGNPMPWRAALAIIRDVCSALAEAHERGVIHRDLKPANIHLGTNGAVKLLDFGIAKVSGGEADDGVELTRMGQTIGTLEYMAPEQIVGGHCEPRTDIYQLGVLMFEMITGRRPFAEATEPTAVITALLTQTPPAPSSMMCRGCLPDDVDTLILRCLQREPDDRFANVRELIDAITRALATRETNVAHVVNPPADGGDEPTWVGGAPAMIHAPAPAPQLAAFTQTIAPTTMPVFEVPVRGSVAEAMPLDALLGEGTGNTTAIKAPLDTDFEGDTTGISARFARAATEQAPEPPRPPARAPSGSEPPPRAELPRTTFRPPTPSVIPNPSAYRPPTDPPYRPNGLAPKGNVTAISEAIVDSLSQPTLSGVAAPAATTAAPSQLAVAPAPPTPAAENRIPFAAKVGLWIVGLATLGGAVGAGIALLAS